MSKYLKKGVAFGFFVLLFIGSSVLNVHAEEAIDAIDLPSPTPSGTPIHDELNDEQLSVEKPDYDPETPLYTRVPSRFALGFRAAIHQIPFKSAIGDLYQVQAEWVIPFQTIGIFSLGGTAGVYALHEKKTAFPYPNYLNTLVGGQLRYQLKFAYNQLFVPTASLEYMSFRLMRPTRAYLFSANFAPSLGVLLNLGWIDRLTARDAYRSIGLTKTFLTLEARPSTFSTELFNLTGTFWLFGIRSEFE